MEDSDFIDPLKGSLSFLHDAERFYDTSEILWIFSQIGCQQYSIGITTNNSASLEVGSNEKNFSLEIL